MAMMLRLLALAVAVNLLLSSPGGAATLAVSRETQTDVMVTIYNGNLGLVKDVRATRLPGGLGEAQFSDVAAMIDPTSVHLKSLTDPARLRILEQNYEYDLLSSEKLLEKYVGKTVRLYQSDGTFHEARLLAKAGPVFEINGQIHLGYSGRLVLPALPENLVARPTLVWLLRNEIEGSQKIEASYLTGGITWKSDYVLILDADDARADLTGWVTINNTSGATYADAALKLVAGDVNRARDGRRSRQALEMASKVAAADASRAFAEEGLFEYHLYTLDGRTTLKDQQTKQLALMSAAGVPVTKHLVYYGAQEYQRTAQGLPMSNQKVAVLLELRNSRDHQLGVPLPRGKVRVYKADASGSQQFVGEDWIDHTPTDERVKIKLGEAFDVVGERTQKEWRKIGAGQWEVEWEISLRNHKKQDQTVTVIEPVPGDWQVLHASHTYDKPEAHTLRFEVSVPRDGTARIVYRVRIRV
jgi:hypothetical protein